MEKAGAGLEGGGREREREREGGEKIFFINAQTFKFKSEAHS